MFPPGSIQRVRDAANIAVVIQSYTPLRKVGQELVCKCLFHNERSASMHVSPAKQLFHCHGCNTGGDVISFIQRIEGVSFPAAVRSLAEQCGVSLESKVDTAAQKRQMAYAAAQAKDAAVYWGHVRRVYERQFETMKAIAFGASDQGQEPIAQRYARRAWYWGRALRRLNAMGPAAALRGFQRVRGRRDVVRLVEWGHEAEQAARERAEEICRSMVAAMVDGEFTEERVLGIVAPGMAAGWWW